MTEEEARVMAMAMIPAAADPLTLGELEQYLGAAADLLRGSIDQADFKQYIFPLMFFKRISDVCGHWPSTASDVGSWPGCGGRT